MNRKLRILCVGHSYVLAVNRAVARELAARSDMEVTVVAPNHFRGDFRRIICEPEPDGSPLRVVKVPCWGSRIVHTFVYHLGPVRRLCNATSFDLIFAWEEPYIFAGWQIARLARAMNLPLCFYTAQNLDKKYPLPFSWIEKKVAAQADGWMAGGRLVLETLLARGYDGTKGVVMPLAVDVSKFQPVSMQERDVRRRELGLQGPVIGFMGRLVPEKGVRILLSALELLPRDMQWCALFLGGGPEKKTILDWAAQRDWQNRVNVILAAHHEVPRYLPLMDILCAPSQTTPRWKEQFGRMVIEAFACGVPVIGSDSGEIPFVIRDAGLVVDEADPALWAHQIFELLDNPARMKELAARGIERAQDFSATHVATQHAAFFRSVLSRSEGLGNSPQ